MSMRTREQIAEIVSAYDLSDRVLWVVEGADYDENAQMMTDEIAECEAILRPREDDYDESDYPEYGMLGEIVNEQMTAMLEEWRRDNEE